VGSAGKPPATARRATYFELSRPFLSHASPRHPAGRPASLFMTVRHGTRYAAMSYVGPPRLRMVRLRGRRPSVTRHGAADVYSADAPEPPPRSWSQRVVEARCQDARGPADLRGRWGVAARLLMSAELSVLSLIPVVAGTCVRAGPPAVPGGRGWRQPGRYLSSCCRLAGTLAGWAGSCLAGGAGRVLAWRVSGATGQALRSAGPAKRQLPSAQPGSWCVLPHRGGNRNRTWCFLAVSDRQPAG
jgi:hypothetical protein